MKKFAVAVAILLLPVVGYVLYSIFPTASNQGYAPEQPIPFSHKLHAGDPKSGGMGIQCLYCHSSAERSQHATVPSVGTCMNCHNVVKVQQKDEAGNPLTDASGQPVYSKWIQMLTEAYEAGRPIEWVRIHELPDFAHFPHNRHVQAGVSCQTCHGPVQEMEKVYQYAPLTMGWCMDCHRGATTPNSVLRTFYPQDQDPRNKPVAPTNCVTCHY